MHESLLADIGKSVLAAAVFGLPAYLVGIPLLLAYLVAGVVLGPHLGFELVKSSQSISVLSEIGLVLLMFILGLEIDITKLVRAGKAVLLNGLIQFVGCVILAAFFFRILGFRAGSGSFDLIYLCVACSLSSTLVVVKILSDRLQLDTLTSRITLGVLVIQDLWAIAFLAVQPNLADLQVMSLLLSLSKAGILVAVGGIMARFVLPWIFHSVGKQPELLLIVAMAWCFGMAGLASFLHLSLEMGALIAGISIASFPYHADIAAKVSSLRDFFIMLFFVALGLQIPRPSGEILELTGAIVAFALVSRLLTVFPTLHLLHYGNRGSLIPALNLSQISEFSLVLCSLGVAYGHLKPEVLSAFILALVITVFLSSFIIPHGHEIFRALNPVLEFLGLRDRIHMDEAEAHARDTLDAEPTIVLLGFFKEASSLLQQLISRRSETAMKQVCVVDFNPEAHTRLTSMGIMTKYADISHSDSLRHLRLERAKILVCTIPDHILKGTTNLKLLRALKQIAPQAKIIVSAETLPDARQMYKEGAAYVFLPRVVSTYYLTDVLEGLESGREETIKTNGTLFVEKWNEVLP